MFEFERVARGRVQVGPLLTLYSSETILSSTCLDVRVGDRGVGRRGRGDRGWGGGGGGGRGGGAPAFEAKRAGIFLEGGQPNGVTARLCCSSITSSSVDMLLDGRGGTSGDFWRECPRFGLGVGFLSGHGVHVLTVIRVLEF